MIHLDKFTKNMIADSIKNRKGARKLTEIPVEVLTLLNAGKIPTVNLTEWLAIDHIKLIETNFSDLKIDDTITQKIKSALTSDKKITAMNAIKLIGSALYNAYKNSNDYEFILKNIITHVSDSIRCYSPYLIALNDTFSIEEKFKQSFSLVADAHFGVREVVWMALRPEIAKNLSASIQFLTEWSLNTNENIRRFTTEATRPRGVWCKHIDSLKENPEQALPILENLKSDTSKYVQDSVGNWLNDASKSAPNFVKNLCEKWLKESNTKETNYIVKKALRTLNKK